MIPKKAEIFAFLDAHQKQHIHRIQDFIRKPSVSPEGTGLESCARFVLESLRECGCDAADIIDVGDGFPGVWGRIDSGAKQTLLIYGHYDVAPVGPEPWSRDPFGGELTEFEGFSKVVIGRGAAVKGPLQAWFSAVTAIRTVAGRLPVNLQFLIEGAELMGSLNFPKLVEARWDDVQKSTGVYWPRATQDSVGTVSATLGNKGLIYLDIIASGSAWKRGPQGASIHSATEAVVDSPVWRLVHALATIRNETGIAIPKFRDAISVGKSIAAWEHALLEPLVGGVETSGPNAVIPGMVPRNPVISFKNGAAGAELLEAYAYGPSINISGLRAGYTGPGTKPWLLPATASATLDIRVITDVPAADLIQMIRAHLDEQGFSDVALKVSSAYDWNQTEIRTPLVQAALTTLAAYGCETAFWPMQAFGGPWAHYAKVLAIPFLLGAAPGHGGRAATSDEFFVIDEKPPVAGLSTLQRYFVDFLYQVAGQ